MAFSCTVRELYCYRWRVLTENNATAQDAVSAGNERTFTEATCAERLPKGTYVGERCETTWYLGDNGVNRSFAKVRITQAPDEAVHLLGKTVVVW